jgi:uncharacterized membrane protein
MDVFRKFLLPPKFKLIGTSLLIIGILFGIIRFIYGIKLSFFDLKWFAVYSKYFETKSLTFLENNFGEEIPILFILIGLLFISLAKENIENEITTSKRIFAFVFSFYINSLFIIGAVLFTFGIGFVEMLIFNIFSYWIIYLIVFHFSTYKTKRVIDSIDKPT